MTQFDNTFRPPVTPAPILAPVAASGTFVAGRNFADLGKALEQVGSAVIASGRNAVVRTVASGRLAAAKQVTADEAFRAKAKDLSQLRQEIEAGTHRVKQEAGRALKEDEIELAAQHLLTLEQRTLLVQSQLRTVEGRQEFQEMADREEAEWLAYIRYASPMEAALAVNNWRWMSPKVKTTIFNNIAGELARTHLALIDKKRAETSPTKEFKYTDEFEKLLNSADMQAVPDEIHGKWEVVLQRGINDRLRNEASRSGKTESDRQIRNARDFSNNAITTLLHDDGVNPDVTQDVIDGLRGIGEMVHGLEDEKLDEYVEEQLPKMLLEAFLHQIREVKDRDPLFVLSSIKERTDLPGYDELFNETNTRRMEGEMALATQEWNGLRDKENKASAEHAIKAFQYATARELAMNVINPVRRASLLATIDAEEAKENRYQPEKAMMAEMMHGDMTVQHQLALSDETNARFYSEEVASGKYGENGPGDYVKTMLLNGKSITPAASTFFSNLLKSGQYAEVGRMLIGAMTLAPVKTMDWLGGLADSRGDHLISALVVNNNLDPNSVEWKNELNKTNDDRIGPWRIAANTAMTESNKPVPSIQLEGGQTLAGDFKGAAAKEWKHHMLVNYVAASRADPLGRLTSEQLFKTAAQMASNQMAEKVVRILTPEGESIFVPRRTYNMGNVTLNPDMRKLENQIRVATQMLNKGFLSFLRGIPFLGLFSDSKPEFRMDLGIRQFDGSVMIPAFIINRPGEVVAWFNFQRGPGGFDETGGAATGNRIRPSLFAFQPFPPATGPNVTEGTISGKVEEEFTKRLLLPSDIGDFQDVENQLAIREGESGFISDAERPAEVQRAKELKRRSNQMLFLERELANRFPHEELGHGWLWRYNPSLGGGRDITTDEYNQRMGNGYDLHAVAMEYAITNITGGLWDTMNDKWKVDRINDALRHLRFPQSHWVDVNLLETDFSAPATGILSGRREVINPAARRRPPSQTDIDASLPEGHTRIIARNLPLSDAEIEANRAILESIGRP